MKRIFIFISIIFLIFLSTGFIIPDRLTIVELNTETLTVGNRELKKGDSFNSDQTIYWKSSKQTAEVQDNDGQLYLFTKEAFDQKNVKTPKEYLQTGKFSTRVPFDSPKIGRNKSYFPEKRVAMVIGNSNYVSRADFLRVPIADAMMVSEKLVDLGFDTYTIFDASSYDLFKAVAKFSETASKYDIALFYYAGHGFSYNHENYYQPVDVSDIDVATVHSCLKASDLMRELSDKSANGTILVMDACRSVAKVRGEDIFAPIEARQGMMLICSTSDGKAAIDAIGENSPFAKAFCDNISIEGQPLYAVALETRNNVREITSGIQSPSFSDNLYSNFVFLPRDDSRVVAPTDPYIQEKKETPNLYNSVRFNPQFIFDLENDILIESSDVASSFKYGTYTGSTIAGHTADITGIGSLNYHKADSYAWAKLLFTLPMAGKLVIECVNDAEWTYDFGLISQIDQELSKSTTADQSPRILKKSFSGQQAVANVVYDYVSAGRHFVTVKFRKDSSGNFDMDRFIITGIKLVGDDDVEPKNGDTEDKHIITKPISSGDANDSNYIETDDNVQDIKYMLVDLGLSVKWATCNLGAYRPEQYGNYFAWGDTRPKKKCTWKNLSYYKSGKNLFNYRFSKYVTSGRRKRGKIDNKTILDSEDDPVHIMMGGKWRMPTKTEWIELHENCNWTWTTQYGVAGYLITSKMSGYTNSSIFLPAAGFCNEYGPGNEGCDGCYWSSSLHTSDSYRAENIEFKSDRFIDSVQDRYIGMSIRPVSE